MPDLTPKNLGRSVQIAFARTKERMKLRLEALKEYGGRSYTGNNPANKKPMNMIYQAVTTMVPNLVYANPRCRVNSRIAMYSEYAQVLGLAVDHLITEINLKQTLRMSVTAALFSEGWIKTGLTTGTQTLEIGGYTHNMGQPYADWVDSEDMVIEPGARHIEEAYYIGDRIRVPKVYLYETGLIDPAKIERLRSRYDHIRSDGEASMLSHVTDSKNYLEENDGLVEFADIVELWVPKYNMMVTIPYDPDGEATEFLREVEYEGPENGPYHMLGFAFMPDNPFPVAPVGMWMDLHEMTNAIARQVKRQAERHKKIVAYEATAWEDAEEIRNSSDGEMVPVGNIDGIKEVEYGGANDQAYNYMSWSKAMFSEMAMSLDLLSGTASGENTATEASMVQGNISVRLSDMQEMVYQHAADVMKALAFYLHTDPMIQLPLIKRVDGQDQQVFYTPEMREGDILDYAISTVPYSMGRKDPATKIKNIMEFTANVIPALANAAQILGPGFNIQKAIEIIGREMNIDELPEIINGEGLMMQMQMEMMRKQGEAQDAQASPDGYMAQEGPETEMNRAAQEEAGEMQAAYIDQPTMPQ